MWNIGEAVVGAFLSTDTNAMAETLDRVNGVTQNHLIVGWVKFKVKNIKYKTGIKTGNLSFSPE